MKENTITLFDEYEQATSENKYFSSFMSRSTLKI